MASPIVVIGKERDKEYMRKEDENCNRRQVRRDIAQKESGRSSPALVICS